MSTVTTRSPADVAFHVAATFDGIFALIDGWRALLEGGLTGASTLDSATVDALVETFAIPTVTGESLLTGAGFVAAPGALADARWHLAWWLATTGAPRGARRLATIDDPSHEQFRDYTALEWWRVPAATGVRHLTGPYVDYVCTDDYTVTVTTPVMRGDVMIGVVGADALVDRLERVLLPVLRSGDAPSTLVNASGRVVTSTDARREPGSMLRDAELMAAVRALPPAPATLSDGTSVLACGDTSLALVVGH